MVPFRLSFHIRVPANSSYTRGGRKGSEFTSPWSRQFCPNPFCLLVSVSVSPHLNEEMLILTNVGVSSLTTRNLLLFLMLESCPPHNPALHYPPLSSLTGLVMIQCLEESDIYVCISCLRLLITCLLHDKVPGALASFLSKSQLLPASSGLLDSKRLLVPELQERFHICWDFPQGRGLNLG